MLGNPKPPDDIMQQLEFMTAVKKKRALDFCISNLRLKLFFEKTKCSLKKVKLRHKSIIRTADIFTRK